MQKLKQEEYCGIGENLKRLRLQKKLTQVDMSRELEFYGVNISRITYNKMEHNCYSIRIKELLVLKAILQCEFEDLFVGLDAPKKLV